MTAGLHAIFCRPFYLPNHDLRVSYGSWLVQQRLRSKRIKLPKLHIWKTFAQSTLQFKQNTRLWSSWDKLKRMPCSFDLSMNNVNHCMHLRFPHLSLDVSSQLAAVASTHSCSSHFCRRAPPTMARRVCLLYLFEDRISFDQVPHLRFGP